MIVNNITLTKQLIDTQDQRNTNVLYVFNPIVKNNFVQPKHDKFAFLCNLSVQKYVYIVFADYTTKYSRQNTMKKIYSRLALYRSFL